MQSDLSCASCSAVLAGRQRRFCSRRCKNVDTNKRHQSYACQQIRGLKRKLELIAQMGGRCVRCGYDRNLAALNWHHLDPGQKSFALDLRSLSNRRTTEIRTEVAKCILVCANCHAEIHWPKLDTALTA